MAYSSQERQRAACRAHYRANKEYYYAKKMKRREKIREWFYSLKQNLRCRICSETHTGPIDFHFIDPAKKTRAVFEMLNRDWGKARIKQELKNCIPLCATCHRKRHFKRNGRAKTD